MLPAVVRWLGLARPMPRTSAGASASAELAARVQALDVAQRPARGACRRARTAGRGDCAPAHAQRHRAGRSADDVDATRPIAAAVGRCAAELIAAEREFLYQLLREGKITDEARRRIERELDLEEASLACKRKSEPDPPL